MLQLANLIAGGASKRSRFFPFLATKRRNILSDNYCTVIGHFVIKVFSKT